MKLKIHSVDNKGELENEVIWIDVLEDISDLSYYMVCDTTYTDDNHISNELRHVFWFPKKSVKKGDWIALRTKNGTNTAGSNNRGTATHTFFWKLGRTIWNKDGDCAVLLELTTWNTIRA
jgi:hypothetical protein